MHHILEEKGLSQRHRVVHAKVYPSGQDTPLDTTLSSQTFVQSRGSPAMTF